MTVLVFGQNGQVAKELARGGEVITAGRAQADFTDPINALNLVDQLKPNLIINAAAYTAVDRAEEDVERANQINNTTPAAIARLAATRNIPFVHISTDYVFDGQGDQPFSPNDQTRPLSVYGQTKLAVEQAITKADGPHIILRTSWVFSSHGTNFVKTMLRLGADRGELNVVADQIGAPTSAQSIAGAVMAAAEQLCNDQTKSGIYHFQSRPFASWAKFAEEIFAIAEMNVRVNHIATADYPTRAVRPLNSRLDCTSFERQFGLALPDWREDLKQLIAQIKAEQHGK